MSSSSKQYFSAGGTLSDNASSYIERRADSQLYEALLDRKYCFLLNARQMGKSSLSVRTMGRLRQKGVACTLIDLTRIGGKNVSAEQWYATLCRETAFGLGIQFDLRHFWRVNEELSPMRRFFVFVRDVVLIQIATPVVLFFDEVDVTMNLSFSADEFFAGIREMYNRRIEDEEYRRITVCLVGVALPTDLIRDNRVTPFNIGERILLRDFSPDEIFRYASQLGMNGATLVRRLHYWTNGHPFLTQSLCATLIQHSEITTAKDFDHLVRKELLEPSAKETNINLVDVGNRVLNSEAGPGRTGEGVESSFRAEILAVYDRILRNRHIPDDESNRAYALLKLSGLVRTDGASLVPRNRIYRCVFGHRWIQDNLPHQEVRRQRKAYLRGVSLAGGLGTIILGSIVALSWVSRVEAIRADANARTASLAAQKANKSANDARQAERKAGEKEALAKNAERRVKGLLADRDRALTSARDLLTQRDRALHQAQNAAASERKSRIESDRLRKLSDQFSFQAYSMAVRNTYADFVAGHDGTALRSLADLEKQGQRGWELSYLERQFHRVGRFFKAGDARIRGLQYWGPGKLVTASMDGWLTIWDRNKLAAVRRFAIPRDCWAIAIPPHGNNAILGERDGSLLSLSLIDGHPIWKQEKLLPSLEGIALSESGSLAVAYSAGPYGRIVTLSPSNGKVMGQTDLGSVRFSSGACSADGRYISVAGNVDGPSNSTICFQAAYRTNSMTQTWIRRDPTMRQVTCMAFAQNGDSIFVGRSDGSTSSVNLRTAISVNLPMGNQGMTWSGAEQFLGGKGWILSAIQSSVTASNGGVCFYSPAESGKIVSRIALQDIWLAKLSPEGREVASTGSDGGIFFWSVPESRRVRNSLDDNADGRFGEWEGKLPGGDFQPYYEAFSPDGQFAIATTGRPNTDEESLHIFRVSNGKELWSLRQRLSAGIVISPNSQVVVVGDESHGVVRAYDLTKGRQFAHYPGTWPLGFSSDGRRILVAGTRMGRDNNNGRVRIYDTQTNDLICDTHINSETITAGAFSPTGDRVAFGGEDHVIRVVHVASGKVVQTMFGHTNDPTSMVFTRDGKRLITNGYDFTTRVWNTTTGKSIAVLVNSNFSNARCHQVCLLGDERRLAVAGIGALNIWDLETGKLMLAIPRNPQQTAIHQLPDGSLLSLGTDGNIFRLDLAQTSSLQPSTPD